MQSLHYDDFALRLEPTHEGPFVARILHSIAGGGAVSFGLPVDPAQFDGLMEHIGSHVRASAGDRHREAAEGVASASETSPPNPEALGRSLHRAIFGDRVGEAWAYHLGRLNQEGAAGLRLRLVFDERTPSDSPLAALPWELLYQDRARGYLARNRRTPVVRHLDVEHPTVLPAIESPLRVLVAAAAPLWSRPLQLEQEEMLIRRAWAGQTPEKTERKSRVELEIVREVTLETLRERLLRGEFHVLHFMGHGEFVESDDGRTEGALVFEDPAGRPRRVPASLLAESLRGLTDLRLVVLNACGSARFPRRRGGDPYSGVAAALVLSGLPAVIAMQFPISDRAALAFGSGLYRALAAGDPVDAAVAEGRFAIADDRPKSLEWATPVLFSRLASGAILGGLAERADRPALRERILDFSGFVEERSRGFVGRHWLFEEIEALRREKGRGYYQIVAEPGVGKSAMVAEMVRRHGWVHHFNQRRENIIRPEAFLSSVCAQLVLAHDLDFADLPPEATRDSNFFTRILGEVSRCLEPRETTVILVDALDESDRDGLAPGVNPLYLPGTVPPGILVLLTTRPPKPGMEPKLENVAEPLELEPAGSKNLADIREYVATFLPRPGIRGYLRDLGLTDQSFVEEMTGKSEGNFMYLSYVLPAIDRGDYGDRSLDEIPKGLKNYYEDNFIRMQGRDRELWFRETLPVLGALAVARDALPFELIHAFSGVEDPRRVQDVLGELRQFLSLSRRETPAGPLEVYRLYHETFFEFIRDNRTVAIDLEKAHERVVQAYLDGKLDEIEGLDDPEDLLPTD